MKDPAKFTRRYATNGATSGVERLLYQMSYVPVSKMETPGVEPGSMYFRLHSRLAKIERRDEIEETFSDCVYCSATAIISQDGRQDLHLHSLA